MKTTANWLVGAALGLFVLAGLTFGATQAFASNAPANTCGAPDQLGSCPPYTTPTCAYWCNIHFYPATGACFGGCCNCTV